MKEYNDTEIIECLRNRESYVVKYLHHRYMPVIRHMILQMGGSNDDAMDIFQEGLMIILEKIDDKNFTLTSKFITLLYCICENLWKMTLQKKKAAGNYVSKALIFEELPAIEDKIDNEMYQKIFTESFNTLDESGKRILSLSWQGMSPAEISEMLGVTYGYVKKKKSESQSELVRRIKSHPGTMAILAGENRIKSVVH